MKKHAYMILAHDKFEQLGILLRCLDYDKNDIFVHIDKKADFSTDKLKYICKYSKIVFLTERYNIHWGGESMIKAEMALLEQVYLANEEYEYIHLISGCDLPLKNQREIHDFFEKHKGEEFVHFAKNNFRIQSMIEHRARCYSFFSENQKCKYKLVQTLINALDKILYKAQILVGVNRFKKYKVVPKLGSQWFSITYDFMKYLVNNKDSIFRYFKYTKIPDEMFVQTMLYNSKFKNNINWKKEDDNYLAIRRCIDWNRGNPYTWRKNDYAELKKSDCLFARKFDITLDKDIIYALVNDVIIE